MATWISTWMLHQSWGHLSSISVRFGHNILKSRACWIQHDVFLPSFLPCFRYLKYWVKLVCLLLGSVCFLCSCYCETSKNVRSCCSSAFILPEVPVFTLYLLLWMSLCWTATIKIAPPLQFTTQGKFVKYGDTSLCLHSWAKKLHSATTDRQILCFITFLLGCFFCCHSASVLTANKLNKQTWSKNVYIYIFKTIIVHFGEIWVFIFWQWGRYDQ